MEKPMSIIRPWKGGLNDYSLYFTIPAEIVRTMGITEDTHLTIKIQDENKITITKNDSKKREEPKDAQSSQETQIKVDDTPNPLDGHEF